MTKQELEKTVSDLTKELELAKEEAKSLKFVNTKLEKENLALNASKEQYELSIEKQNYSDTSRYEMNNVLLENQELKKQNSYLIKTLNNKIEQLEQVLNLYQNLKDSVLGTLNLSDTIFKGILKNLNNESKEEENN